MDRKKTYDAIIIGGGIVGAAVFHQLQHAFPNAYLLLLEKESKVGKHQTGRNSGVIHSGIYYKPGSLKAENCKKGRTALVEFAKKHNVAHEVCGKVIVANQNKELQTLETIFKRGIENKTHDIEKITTDQIREIEPYCTNSIAGIRVGSAGIIDYVAFNEKLLQITTSTQEKSKALFNQEVIEIKREGRLNNIRTKKGLFFQGNCIINCTGLQADRMAKKNYSKALDCKIVPFRGDYYELSSEATHKVKHLIYPVPDTDFPFLGVHE